jgi:phage regulator Rha-like protein
MKIMNELATISKNATMSSIELVGIINQLRPDGQAELLHKTFLVKVLKVLGNLAAENSAARLEGFAGTYKDTRGKEQKCYNLPKRESHLMVMSESYKVQAAVYDRWQELETANPKLPTSFAAALRLAADVQEKLEASQLQLEAKTAQLDESMEWYSIKRVAANNGKSWQEYSWQDLKRKSFVLGKPPKKIFDANYGEVNTYHTDAWMEVYPADMYVFA